MLARVWSAAAASTFGAAVALTAARTLHAAQSAAQRFDFLFVRGLLTLRYFQQLEHFIHFIESIPQGFDDLRYLINRFLNCVGRRAMPWLGGRRRWRCVFRFSFAGI